MCYKEKRRCIGICVAAFGIGVLIACLLPWTAVSFAVAAISVVAGVLIAIN